MAIVNHQHTDSGILQITLNNHAMRNALSIKMFDALGEAIEQANTQTKCVLLKGEGVVFCSGFDMKACAGNLPLLEQYILRLTTLIRTLRRLSAPVVVAAHGAAIAGGCAILTGCNRFTSCEVWISSTQNWYFACGYNSNALSKIGRRKSAHTHS